MQPPAIQMEMLTANNNRTALFENKSILAGSLPPSEHSCRGCGFLCGSQRISAFSALNGFFNAEAAEIR
jgi:hypothetical protein